MTQKQYFNHLLEHYSLVCTLSDKNDCTVYRMRNKATNKDLILRLFKNPIIAYEELLKIEFENLPLIFDVIKCDDGQIVLEEYIDGITLAQSMECAKYSYKTAKKIINKICHALIILHERKIIHRDIKPENIMIDKNGRIILIDFNASRKNHNTTNDTIIMGTVGYASPEQLGIRETDPRTDIYSLGVLLNVMLTGKHPSEKIVGGKAGRIVRKCTNVNPDERYQTANKLIRAL